MGRKSLARERRRQILDAFEECILERGLDRASIGAVAEAAGMDRTLVHHYFGTRDALESALVDRLLSSYKAERDAIVAALPDSGRLHPLLDYLFGPEFDDPRSSVLFDELFSASHRSPSTKARLREVYEEFEQITNAEIEKAFPRTAASQRHQVAYGIMCLADAASCLNGLGFPASRRSAARASAEALLRTLDGPPGP